MFSKYINGQLVDFYEDGDFNDDCTDYAYNSNEERKGLIFTCSCCKHCEFRDFIGGASYIRTITNEYMYSGSHQCDCFELKDYLVKVYGDYLGKI